MQNLQPLNQHEVLAFRQGSTTHISDTDWPKNLNFNFLTYSSSLTTVPNLSKIEDGDVRCCVDLKWNAREEVEVINFKLVSHEG